MKYGKYILTAKLGVDGDCLLAGHDIVIKGHGLLPPNDVEPAGFLLTCGWSAGRLDGRVFLGTKTCELQTKTTQDCMDFSVDAVYRRSITISCYGNRHRCYVHHKAQHFVVSSSPHVFQRRGAE